MTSSLDESALVTDTPTRANRRRRRRQPLEPFSNLRQRAGGVNTISTVGTFSSGCMPDRDAAAIVFYADAAIGIEGDDDVLCQWPPAPRSEALSDHF